MYMWIYAMFLTMPIFCVQIFDRWPGILETNFKWLLQIFSWWITISNASSSYVFVFILYLVICACSNVLLNLKHVIKSVRWIKKGFFFVRHGHINYPLASSCLNDKQVYACQNLIADKELARNIRSQWKSFWNRVIEEQKSWTSLLNQFKNICFHHRK